MSDTVTVTLSRAQVEAIGYALDLAYGDQEAYLNMGSPVQDYGDEWPAVADMKSREFVRLAAVADMLGLIGERERWMTPAGEVVK